MKLKNDNRGLSLAELIVAVAILGIVAVPLLHTFVTSARTTAKSATTGNATIAAENIQETIEATHMDVLTAPTTDLEALFGADDATLEEAAGVYTLTLEGIQVSGSTFDAAITLDPDTYDTNTATDVTQYTPMDILHSQGKGADDAYDPDTMAAKHFHNDAVLKTQGAVLCDADGNEITLSDNDFWPDMAREIEIDYLWTELSKLLTIEVKYGYTYEFSYYVKDVAGGVSEQQTVTLDPISYTYSLFSETLETSEPLSDDLPSLYFLYNRHVNKDKPSEKADITIRNNSDLPAVIFVAEQETGGAPYNTKIDLRESITGTKPCAQVYCNIGGSGVNYYDFWILKGEVWYKDGDFGVGDLVAKAKEDRLYAVTIAISAVGGGEALFTLNASKLD